MDSDAVTILITDMEGSTAFTESRGDERAMEILRTHERITREAIAAHGGREIKSMGDGFMVSFEVASSAVACALDLMTAVDDHVAAQPDMPIRIRAGVNRGTVIEESGDLYGTTVNAASRIAAKARSGQVLVSESVRDAVADDAIEFADRGLFWLKGLRERWRLFEAIEPGKTAAVAQTVTLGRTPFVDREDERAALRVRVDATLEGRGGLVVLTGESGAGKTRLAEELGAEAAGRGMSVLVGRCYDATSSHPFAPIVEILEHVERESTPERFRAVLGETAAEIARIMPQIRRAHPDVPPPTDLPPEQERRFLFVSLRAVLVGLAESRPLLIVLDDIQWADEPTLLFLEQLAGDLPALPILIVATYPREGAPRPELEELMVRLGRRHVVERLNVGPIPLPHAGVMLSTIVGEPAPVDLVRHLHEETGGNAFFFEEVVRHLLAEGRLLDDDGRWMPQTGVDLDVPETVRLTIGRRLNDLSPRSRSMLTTAAVIGRAFGFELLEDLIAVSEDDLLDDLDEAERARLITSSSDGGDVRFGFAHELIRQTLISELTLARRQIVHLKVADSLERVFAGALDDHIADLAYHLVEAGRRADPDRVVRVLLLAGERALDAAAYEESLRHLTRALTLIAADDHRMRAQALEMLGKAHRSLAHLDDAITAWVETLDEFEALGDRDAMARLCLDAGFQIALWRSGRHLRPLITRGLEAIGDRRTGHRGGLLALSAALASDAGNYDGAQELFDEAVELARESGDANVLGLTLYVRCYHHHHYQQFAKCIELGEESIDLLRKGSDVWTLANAIAHVGSSYAWSGRFDRGAEVAGEGRALAERLGNWSAYYTADRARFFRRFGREPDLRRLEDDGLRDDELGRRLEIRWLIATGRGRMALAAFWQGRWDEALAWYTEAAQLESSVAAGGHHARLALCHAYMGQRAEALELIDASRPIFPRVGQANTTTAWLAALLGVEALAVLGVREAAAELYPVVVDARGAGILLRPWDFRIVETLAGVAASCAGDWETAETHFASAARTADELPERIEIPEVRRFLVRMLLDRNRPGDLQRARAEAELACEEYKRIGMPAHEELIRSMSAQA